jgi:hypothetical protein
MQIENNNVFRTVLKPFGSQYELTQHIKETNTKNTVYLNKDDIMKIFKESCEKEYLDKICDLLERGI